MEEVDMAPVASMHRHTKVDYKANIVFTAMAASPSLLPLIVSAHASSEDMIKEQTLDVAICRLDFFLRILGFRRLSSLSRVLSWIVFFILAIALPLLIGEYFSCAHCERYLIKHFELRIVVSESTVAAMSLLCISKNLCKYGTRKFLFVDGNHGFLLQFQAEYTQKIYGFFRILAMWILPCLLIKTAREVVRVMYVGQEGSWVNATVVSAASIVSWTYCALLYLSGAALFHLVCSLQLTHLEYFIGLLERDLDISLYIEHHTSLTHYLSKISHRFRVYLLLEFLMVSAFQFAALVDTTGNRRTINFINSGDLAVCSLLQLVGIVLCLLGAAKISHRAHGIVSVASRWHAVVTANSAPAFSQSERSGRAADLPGGGAAIPVSFSTSDLDSLEAASMPTDITLLSSASSFQKRQAFVTYLQSNFGGFTIYGWTIDRMLINTIFFLQFSVVLFVLGKTVTFRTG